MSTEETEHKKAIKKYLTLKGAFFYYNLAGLGVFPGIPDITCIHKGVVYQIEVKAGNGKQNPNQIEFQENWEKCGGVYILGGIDEVMKIIK